MRRLHIVLLLCVAAYAHISIWHPSTWDADRGNKQSAKNSDPIEMLPFNEWWWHNNLDYPPPPGVFFELPANGKADMECSSNRAFTSIGFGLLQPNNPRQAPEPWAEGSDYFDRNNLHAPGRTNVSGCAIAITYKSNEFDVKPEDFVVFTVVHDCPARPLQSFDIPNLPACPPGGCICSWFWIHKSVGGSDQNYMTPFRCNVTNAKPDATAVDVARARAPRKCHKPADCSRGPRNPMYWKQLERNNMPDPSHYAPNYGILYGFPEGAQRDIFVNTNREQQNVVPFPAEQICKDAALNPKGLGSRLVSAGGRNNITTNGDGLISPSGKYKMYQQGGQIIIQGTTKGDIPWTCQCGGVGGPFKFVLGTDGSLTITNTTGYAHWSSQMTKGYGKAPYRLQLQDEGYLTLFDGTGANIWESWFFDRREANYSPFDVDPAEWHTSELTGSSWALAPALGLMVFVALLF